MVQLLPLHHWRFFAWKKFVKKIPWQSTYSLQRLLEQRVHQCHNKGWRTFFSVFPTFFYVLWALARCLGLRKKKVLFFRPETERSSILKWMCTVEQCEEVGWGKVKIDIFLNSIPNVAVGRRGGMFPEELTSNQPKLDGYVWVKRQFLSDGF